jgi:hypothetical protein
MEWMLDSTTKLFDEYSDASKGLDGKEDWPITQQVQRLLERNGGNGEKPKRLGVTWSNLTVKGVSNDAVFNENVISQFNPFGKGNKSTPLKTIIQDSFGCVKPGGASLEIQSDAIFTTNATTIEMLLVLGNPGAGCTTLLNMLSNRRLGYAEINGEVTFGSLSSDEARNYRSQIVQVWVFPIDMQLSLTRTIERRRRGFLSNLVGRTYT